jgi:hypothetical protein
MLIYGKTPEDIKNKIKEILAPSKVIKGVCFVFQQITNLIKWLYGKIKNIWCKYIQR